MITAYRVGRDVVHVSGPEAPGYLQGQVSQDVEAMTLGATERTFVLQPTGKVEAWARVTRIGGEEFVLDVDAGYGEAMATRLRRFLLRTKADIELVPWTCVALRASGPGEDVGAAGAAGGPPAAGAGGLAVPAGWPGVGGVDLLGPDVAPPPDVPLGDVNEYEALRIAAGVPAMGSELTEKTIPAEAGQWVVDASVNFTKGCFTGQELVARIDSRGGNVPRLLRGLVVEGDVTPPSGADVVVDGETVGTVTSAVRSRSLARILALAYIRRAVAPPVGAVVRWPEGESAADLRPLPLDLPA